MENRDILLALGLSEESEFFSYFDAYLTENNEVKALVRCEKTYTDLERWKADSSMNYSHYKKLIDDYVISDIETEMIREAKDGTFKNMEYVLTHRSDKYKKTKKDNDGTSAEDLVGEALSYGNKG